MFAADFNIGLGIVQPSHKLVVEVVYHVVSRRQVCLGGLWSHSDHAVAEHCFICHSKGLDDESE